MRAPSGRLASVRFYVNSLPHPVSTPHPDSPAPDIHSTLRRSFGFEQFRPGQEEVVRQLLAGKSALAVFPSCYLACPYNADQFVETQIRAECHFWFSCCTAGEHELAATRRPDLAAMNRFRDEDIVFNCQVPFPERIGRSDYFVGEGEFISIAPGRHQWETNFVADLSGFELRQWDARGAGGSNLRFMLTENTIGAHSSEMPVGTYKKGHRHFDGVCVFAVTGKGYSLLWREEDADFTRIDWEHGCVYCPPDSMFHQHFNISNHPSRYLALQIGTVRYPLLQMKREIWTVGVDKDVKQGGAQVEYEDQDPRVHRIWLDEIARHGVESRMGPFIDETKFMEKP